MLTDGRGYKLRKEFMRPRVGKRPLVCQIEWKSASIRWLFFAAVIGIFSRSFHSSRASQILIKMKGHSWQNVNSMSL